MPSNLKPVAKKQFVLTIEGVAGNFTKCTAPKVTREENQYNDGQTGQTRTHLGFTTVEKVTLSKNYDAVADKVMISWLEETLRTNRIFTATIQPIQADLAGTVITGSGTFMLTECQLVSVTYPEADREGSGLSMFSLELVPGTVALQ